MTRTVALPVSGSGNPRLIPVAQCDVCGTVSRLNTKNGMGLWVCDPCLTDHLMNLTKGDTDV